MSSGILHLDRSTCVQLGAVAVVAGLTVCAGGVLGPLGIALLGAGAASFAGEVARGLVPNILSGLFAKTADSHQAARDKAARETQNHHVQRGINLAVAACLEEAAASYTKEVNPPPYLTETAAAIRKNPLILQVSQSAPALQEEGITTILSGSIEQVLSRSPLSSSGWEALLQGMAASLGVLSPTRNVDKGVEFLVKHFTDELIKVYKELGVASDPAWFALVLRFLMEIRGEVKANSAALAEIKTIVTAHTGALEKASKGLLANPATGAPPVDPAFLAAVREDLASLAGDFPALRTTLDEVLGYAKAAAEQATAANAKAIEILAALQSQGVLLALEDRAPPRPLKYIERAGPMKALVDALWGKGRASITGQAATAGARAAAQGEGGQGKSVLSLAYAEKHAQHYPGGCYRVVVENQSLETALAKMIPALPALAQMPQADKARLARAFLSRDPRCLLIIDNVDRAADWNARAFQDLIPSGACHVIVTSREENLPGITPVNVGKLEEAEARGVLAAFRPSAAEARHATAVASILRSVERLAVAVASVGALMAIAEDDDWAAYAARLETIPLDQYPEGQAGVAGHTGYSGRVYAALDDLFNRLPIPAQRAMEYAALLPEDLIPAVDHLNGNPPEVTPADWLVMLLEADTDPEEGEVRLELGTRPTGRPWEPRDFVKKLQSLGLLTPATPDRTLWSLHRLHAKRCRERAEAANVERIPLILAIAAVAVARKAKVVGVNEPGKMNAIDNPHVLTDATLRWELTPLVGVAKMLCKAGVLGEAERVAWWLPGPLRLLGRLNEARDVLDALLADAPAARAALGDTDIAALLSNLALIELDMRDLGAARANMEQAIAIQLKYFVHDHPIFATNYSNLATIQHQQGDLPAARASMERAIAIDLRHSVPDHPIFAIRYSNLALIQKDHGNLCKSNSDFAQAESELASARANMERAIAIKLKHFAPDHPTLATSYNNLAHICIAEGNIPAAVALWRKSYPIRLKALGPDHPYTKGDAAMLGKYDPSGP
jgi:tetratricopeptide (TPR) repeat protein